MAPLFVTFEGLDGSGKSTHLKRAAAWMERRGFGVRVTQEPGGTPVGEAIRRLFLDPSGNLEGHVEALLLFASRKQQLTEVIEPELAAGRHVLCDRFTDSTFAYQGHGRGLPLDWIDDLDRLATGRRRPDHTLLLDLPPETARQRGQSPKRRSRAGGVDRLDAEELAFYSRVRAGYLELAEREPGRIRVVDSSGETEETWSRVEAWLGEILGAGG